MEVGGRQSSVRVQELEQLQAVAVAQHLAVNPFAKAACSSRSNLRLCTYSFELLMHHLQVRPGDRRVVNTESNLRSKALNFATNKTWGHRH